MIRDGGPFLIGNGCGADARMYEITIVANPTNAPSQIGTVGIHVGLLKVSLAESGIMARISLSKMKIHYYSDT